MADPTTGKKILLAEDDKFLSTAMADKLGREGFVVLRAMNGVDAVELAKTEKPDLILLDIIMPQKTGFEVLSELRLDPTTHNIPIIVLSNLGQEADIKRARDLGAMDYLVKSDVEMKLVVAKIKEAMARLAEASAKRTRLTSQASPKTAL
ncbi:MAG: response regulator [Patescibacteria group bacterium]